MSQAAIAASQPIASATASAPVALAAKCRPGDSTLNSTASPPRMTRTTVVSSARLTDRMRQSAPSAAPNITARAPTSAALARRIGVVAMSAFSTATPPARNPSRIDAFSCAMPSTLAKASRCAGATVVIIATSRSAIRARGAISPGWFIPISITANSVSCGIRASVKGTPQWLL